MGFDFMQSEPGVWKRGTERFMKLIQSQCNLLNVDKSLPRQTLCFHLEKHAQVNYAQ